MPPEVLEYLRSMGKAFGKLDGKKAAKNMTADERSARAKKEQQWRVSWEIVGTRPSRKAGAKTGTVSSVPVSLSSVHCFIAF